MAVKFSNLIETLGGKVTPDPIKLSPNWELWRANFTTPAGDISTFYLYLYHKCPKGEASQATISAWQTACAGNAYEVVASSRSELAIDLKETARLFGGKSATTPRRMLAEFLLAKLGRNESPEDLQNQYFIGPDLKFSDGNEAKALSHTTDWLLNQDSGGVAVLLAGAGLGKTTLARAIAQKIWGSFDATLATPLLVESGQWRNLIQSNMALQNVWEAAIANTFSNAGLVSNPRVFELLIEERLLIPIFDGFDELCLFPDSTYTPSMLINKLLDLSDETGARILVTTRETFWELSREGIPLAKIQALHLQGFSNEQRKQYFEKRLNAPSDRDIARRIASEIGGALYEGHSKETRNADRASGVPFILDLIALYVESNPKATFAPKSGDPIGHLLENVCTRENLRHSLELRPELQMEVFENLFRDVPGSITREDLELYLGAIGKVEDTARIRRFESHAFLSPTGNGTMLPRFEILRTYFISRWLALHLESAKGETEKKVLLELLGKNSTGRTDIIESLAERLDKHDAGKLIHIFRHSSEMMRANPMGQSALSALFHLSLEIADRRRLSKSEKATFLLHHLGDSKSRTFVRCSFIGIISGTDFSGVAFTDCYFSSADFRNCIFDQATSFEGCKFHETLGFSSCEGIAKVKLSPTCALSVEAGQEWYRHLGVRHGDSESKALAEESLRRALSKFIGAYGFRNLMYKDRMTGTISTSPLRDETWDELIKSGVIERYSITNVAEGGLKISVDPSCRHEARVFLDNGALGKVLRGVIERLAKKL